MQTPALPSRVALKAPQPFKRGMEFVQEETDYNVAEFFEQFQNYLPKTVVVSQGFCGEIVEEIFDRGQVLRINAISKQRRVIAKIQYLGASKLISIPDSYEEKLCIVKRSGKCGKPKDIYFILKENPLPLTVQFPKDQTVTVGNQTISSNNIPNIELMQTFDEVCLLGNIITNGTMDQDVVPVPLYLSQLTLALVTGIKGQSKEKWTEFQEELDHTASYIEYDQQFGNPNIAEYDPSAIHSDVTYTYVEPRLYSNIVKLVHKTPSRAFENTTYSPELHHNDDPGVYEEIDKATMDKCKPSTKTNTQDERGNQPRYKDELETVLKSNARQTEAGETQEITPELSSFGPHMTKNNAMPIKMPKPNARYSYMKPGFHPPIPERKHTPSLSKAPQAHDETTALYSNDIPRGKVSPTVNVEYDTNSDRSVEHGDGENVVRELNNSEDVAKLTIDEVSVYLKKLKLGKYTEIFQTQLIDGRMLVGLDKDLLKEEFGMTGIEALRIMNFAKDGHVPS